MSEVKNINITKNSSKQSYQRPEKTYTDTIQSTEEMKKKLVDYVRVDNIECVPINSHLRYVTLTNSSDPNKKRTQRFCVGGFLVKKFEDYVILKNSQNISWSVQKYHWNTNTGKKEEDVEPIFTTIFFKKKSQVEDLEELVEELSTQNNEMESRYQELLEKKTEEITILQNKVERLADYIKSNR